MTYGIAARRRNPDQEQPQGRVYSVNKPLYALRSRIECFIGPLKEQRRVATRYDKLATSFVGFVLLGCVRIWGEVCPQGLVWRLLPICKPSASRSSNSDAAWTRAIPSRPGVSALREH